MEPWICEQEKRIAELEARELGYIQSLLALDAAVAELREAAREAVDAVRFQKPEHERAAIDALAALLEVKDGLS
jgi:hypothetical protein